MKHRFFLLVLLGGVLIARADEPAPVDAEALLRRACAQRATTDFALKGRLWIERQPPVLIELWVHNSPHETRSLYRVGGQELLIVQPVGAPPRWYQLGTGELTGTNQTARWAGSHFTAYDLALPFVGWAGAKLVGEEKHRGQNCYLVEVTAPDAPYAKARLWLAREYGALLRVDLFDSDEALVRRLTVGSFKRLGELWIPRSLEVTVNLRFQSLPAQEKSRLEIYDGSYDTPLPAALLDEKRFAPSP
jgi:hypothetical protein